MSYSNDQLKVSWFTKQELTKLFDVVDDPPEIEAVKDEVIITQIVYLSQK